jgi:beta-lactamase regulating signal transducer with metallopeptidase domain
MAVMSFLTSNHLLPSLTWTLLHSLWQGLLLTVLAGLVLLLTRRSTAALRYAVLCTLFFLFLGGVSLTFLAEWNARLQTAVSIDRDIQSTGFFPPPLFLRNWVEQLTFFLNKNAQWIVLAWLVVFLYKSARMLVETSYIRALRRYKTLMPDVQWTTNVQTLACVLCIRKTVSLLESALVKVPVVIGHFKPLILMPVGLLNHLPPGEIEAVLLHELAHIRRHDFLVNFIQRLAEALFFFNPGLLWVSSLLRVEREACCDEMAISHTKNKLQFVQALIGCKKHSLSAPAYAIGLFGKKNVLHWRLDRIVTNCNKTLSPFEAAFFALNLMVLTIILSGWGSGTKFLVPSAVVRADTAQSSLSKVTTLTPEEQHPDKKKVTHVLVRELRAATTNERSSQSLNQNISEIRQPAVDRKSKSAILENVTDIHVQFRPDKEWIHEIGNIQETAVEMRDQQERDRLQAEIDRTQAHKDREQAAKEREQAEKDRQQAEKDRDEARKLRERAAEDLRRIRLQ